METRLNLNKNALMLVKEMIEEKIYLNLGVNHYKDGIVIIDGGVNVKGGFKAGLYFSEVCMGGLGEVEFSQFKIDDYLIPAVKVQTDHPLEACILSQYAGWKIKKNNFSAMGSGPGRILAAKEELYNEYSSYHESRNPPAVIVLESSKLPDEKTAEAIVNEMCTPCTNSYILVAPTESLVGSIQISARIVETGLHKMHQLNFNLENIETAWGICPVSPTAKDTITGIGRTNDAILYGGTAFYQVYCEDSEIKEILTEIPASASEDYGQRFLNIYQRYNNFYDIDPLLFSPAKVIINNRKSGKSFKAGQINHEVLKKSFFKN